MSLHKICLFALFAVILAVGVSTVLSEADNRDLSILKNLRRKLARCVGLMTRSGLPKGEREVLQRCAMASIVVPPMIPHVIAMRFAKCVLSRTMTGPLQIAGNIVTQCVNDPKPSFPWYQMQMSVRRSELAGTTENVLEDTKSSEWK